MRAAAAGFVVGFVGLLALARCGTPLPVSPCQVQAVLALPLDDPDAISVGDTMVLAKRLKACNAGDAGP